MTLMDQGKHPVAEPLLRRALAVFRKNVGDRHCTASSVCNLADLLQLRHQDKEAETLFREGLPLLVPAGCRIADEVGPRLTSRQPVCPETARSFRDVRGCFHACVEPLVARHDDRHI